MQRIFSSWIMAALFIFPSLALAMENHTLSLGYAQTHLSALNKSASKDLHGLNLKYRYEFNSEWGILTSLTATRHDVQITVGMQGNCIKMEITQLVIVRL